MTRSIRYLLAVGLLAGAVLAASCAKDTARPVYPAITFIHQAVIDIDVARIDYVQAYDPPGAPPFVDHLFPQPPAGVVRRWPEDRLRAVGVSRSARVTLEDARVVSEALATTSGLEGWFTVDQEENLSAHVAMRIEILDDRGQREAYVVAEARRTRTLPENLTLNERDNIAFRFTQELMTAFDAALEAEINTHLTRYLR